MARRIASWLLTAGLLVALWQYQAIIDWWVLRNYVPNAEVKSLASVTTMTPSARRIFYLSTPEIDNKANFTRHCPVGELRQALVLGCYYNHNIFVLRIEDAQLKGVMPVTAAHEMLHAAYDRLSNQDREEINQEIIKFYPQIKDAAFAKLIKEYQRSEPGQLYNELHSLLPTEIVKLSPELEDYYERYFQDRAQVIKQFKQYQAVFVDLNAQREQLITEVNQLKTQIESTEAQAQAAIARANQLSAQIQQLRAEGKTEESNQLVPAQNAAANQANTLISQTQTLIDQYNQKVRVINQLALIEQDLYDKLDASNLESVRPR